jgi:hypothetical protein
MSDVMKALMIAGLLTTAALPAMGQSTQYVNPGPNGSYTITRPFSDHPVTWVNRTPGGGYTAVTPGAPTTYANPTIGGGYTIVTPLADQPATRPWWKE